MGKQFLPLSIAGNGVAAGIRNRVSARPLRQLSIKSASLYRWKAPFFPIISMMPHVLAGAMITSIDHSKFSTFSA